MLKKLKKSLASVKTKEIVDIIVFGSAVKGKIKPGDIDLGVIFRESISFDIVKEIESKIKKLNLKAHISILTVDDFFTSPHSLIRTMLIEGISLMTGKAIAEQYGLSAYSLYSYSLKDMKASEKVRFVYVVKGRKSRRGIVGELGGIWITDSCFISPMDKDDEFIEMLKKWGVRYKRKQILLMN